MVDPNNPPERRRTLTEEIDEVFGDYLPDTLPPTLRRKRSKLRSHLCLLWKSCVLAVRQEFKLKRWYKGLSVLAVFYNLFIFFVTLDWKNPIPSWSKRTRAILVLSGLVLLLGLVIEALYSFNQRKMDRLKRNRRRTADLLRAERESYVELTKTLVQVDQKNIALTSQVSSLQQTSRRLRDQVADLAEQGFSKLKMRYEPNKPYFNILESGRSGNNKHFRSYFRIQVENTGGKAIEGVKVQIKELIGFYNIPLRVLNDTRTEFSLNPGQPEMIEVATKHTSENEIRINTLQNTAMPYKVPAAFYRLTIIASGKDTTAAYKLFLLSVDAHGNLSVKEVF